MQEKPGSFVHQTELTTPVFPRRARTVVREQTIQIHMTSGNHGNNSSLIRARGDVETEGIGRRLVLQMVMTAGELFIDQLVKRVLEKCSVIRRGYDVNVEAYCVLSYDV
ncbi:hypothetical protein CEXT_774691 [Caerostris extrusa]|uniref:Uncharacterized protein n=1 Tax=Caerostris extrusa TaxID=172846 RepID=A0AAV4VKN3_CAEEX|nr:hypothetical protein CEXT_774691 [Caerostris extrusa]